MSSFSVSSIAAALPKTVQKVVKCNICYDLWIKQAVFYTALLQGTKRGCVYCDMVVRTIEHFKLVSFVGSEAETGDSGDTATSGESTSKDVSEVDLKNLVVDIMALRGRQQDWPGLRICVLTLDNKRSPVVEFNTPAAVPGVELPFVSVFEHIPQHGASEETYQQLQQWIKECTTTHEYCSVEIKPLPTRVLQILDNENVRLHEPSAPETARYIALSHCWGSSKNRAMTLKSNIHLRKAGIPWTELGKTYRDAITITRKLGIDYVWIDSLCIIQDDKEDWERQAAQMASIYENAFLTIRAMWSKDGDAGILSERFLSGPAPEQWYQAAPFDTGVRTPDRSPHHNEQSPLIFARLLLEHHIRETMRQTPGFEDKLSGAKGRDIECEPLATRAWAFQEHILSTRAVLYQATEIMWECGHMRRCECELVKQLKFQTPAQAFGTLLVTADFFFAGVNNMGEGWPRVVKTYTKLSLTFESDRLPALSGLASRYSRLCHKRWDNATMMIPGLDGVYIPDPAPPNNGKFDLRVRYLAGLWETELPLNLLWYRVPESGSEEREWRYTGPYRAPSWSWASGTRPVDWNIISQEEQESFLARAEVGEVGYKQKGLDPFSDAESAVIVLTGLVVEGIIAGMEDRCPRFKVKGSDITTPIRLDCTSFTQDAQNDPASTKKHFLLELHRSLKTSYGLVLCQQTDINQFERIGIYDREEKWELMKYYVRKPEEEDVGGRLVGGSVRMTTGKVEGGETRLGGGSLFAGAMRRGLRIV